MSSITMSRHGNVLKIHTPAFPTPKADYGMPTVVYYVIYRVLDV